MRRWFSIKRQAGPLKLINQGPRLGSKLHEEFWCTNDFVRRRGLHNIERKSMLGILNRYRFEAINWQYYSRKWHVLQVLQQVKLQDPLQCVKEREPKRPSLLEQHPGDCDWEPSRGGDPSVDCVPCGAKAFHSYIGHRLWDHIGLGW